MRKRRRSKLLDLIFGIEVANAKLLEHLTDVLVIVHAVHGPEGLDGATRSHEDLLLARMGGQEVGDVINTGLECHPNARSFGIVLLHLCAGVYREAFMPEAHLRAERLNLFLIIRRSLHDRSGGYSS